MTKRLMEITPKASKINSLSGICGAKEINLDQAEFDLGIERERDVAGIGMGVLSDGTPYLNQRGLASLCGVQNAHIGTISGHWNDPLQKPRITSIKSILENAGFFARVPHVEIVHKGKVHFCYPAEFCLAVLEYYAFDAGVNCQPEARQNFRQLAGSKLRELIYSEVGYDPSGKSIEPLRKWLERVELNHQSAPNGYFSIFNEAHTLIYELIKAGANVGEKMVVDISIGIHWAKFWDEQNLSSKFGNRAKFPHRYPADHPQAKSNPQIANCYPDAALGEYRRWLQDHYLGGGKFAGYLKGRVPSAVATLAIERLNPPEITSSR